MPVCPACSASCPEGSRFCLNCGIRLAVPAGPPAERRIVTTLCCDLVAFTALSERVDQEDADGLLREYYALARGVVEMYGGVIEKFAGDAVLAVFGLPSVHEDDADRAVRAALRLAAGVSELTVRGVSCEARVGVNTGPALVRLDVDPSSGIGFLAGDAINVAARLQALAPPGGVAVGEMTQELTSQAFDYEQLPAATVKGKQEPLHPWLARGPVGRTGVDLQRRFSTPLVGREVELAVLRGLFEKAMAGRTPQFALVVGEAGIGKSRLAYELAQALDRQPGLMLTWRQGRCLPYDEPAPFWALSEIVRAQLGITESDAPHEAEAKLAKGLPPGPDHDWLAARLRPLLGLAPGAATREENFSAWLRFLEGLARAEPTVLLFEDLHWASEGTLVFLRHLTDHAADLPLLVVGTTRPELLERDTPFTSVAARWMRIDVRSLSAAETGRMVEGMIGAPAVAAEVEEAIARRCGGNPFFTEELLHFLQEKRLIVETDAGVALSEAGGAALPASVHGLIAARLETLKPAHKQVLADAAVVGQTFWPAAVASLGNGDRRAVEEALGLLAEREFVRQMGEAAMDGETEYTFWHALTRDVAYQQLPRAARARKHAVVAQWVEAHPNVWALADTLAHHYVSALELARAAGEAGLSDELQRPAVRALRMAGDRALNLDVEAAVRYYARAVDLVAADDPDRPHLLVAWSAALGEAGRLSEACTALDEAATAFKGTGDRQAAAVALTRRAYWGWLSTGQLGEDVTKEALELVGGEASSRELVVVLEGVARNLMIGCEAQGALRAAEEALAVCAELGMRPSSRALNIRAIARCESGDARGIDDFRAAIEHGTQQDANIELGDAYLNLGAFLEVMEGPRAAEAAYQEGLRWAEERHSATATAALQGLVEQHLLLGAWDAAIEEASAAERDLAHHGDRMDLAHVRSNRALLLTWRGAAEEAHRPAAWAEAVSARTAAPWIRAVCLTSLAAVEMVLGRGAVAARRLEEVDALGLAVRTKPDYPVRLPTAMRTAAAAGDLALAQRLTRGLPARRRFDALVLLTLRCLLAEADEDWEAAARLYGRAAAGWRRMAVPYERALALVGQGRVLLRLARPAEAELVLRQACDILDRLGARPALAEARLLLDSVRP